MVTDEMRQKAYAAYENTAGTCWSDPIDAALDAVAPLIVAQARREALEEAAAAVEKRAIELGRQECCGRPVGYQEPECCGDPLFMIANEEAATAIRALANKPKETTP